LDYGLADWAGSLPAPATYDLVVSGFSIHHQSDARKRGIYRELFGLLNPGGLFLNLEHVQPASQRLTELSDALFIDGMAARDKEAGGNRTHEDLAAQYLNRPDKEANILAPVAAQCQWLEEIGFENVDCYFKIFELALFGGQKPVA
jgi:tRNA (cmo5U34)-methyltransferase